MPTREAVMTALLAKAATAAAFQTVSRRVELVPGAPTPTVATPPAQPALYLYEGDEIIQQSPRRGLATRTFDVALFVWCRIPLGETLGVPDGTTPGATVINTLIEAIEAALAPDNPGTGCLTLGGLVEWCRIEGRILKVPGDINPDGQCFAEIPIKILVP
jgi:hypothetical protein